MSRNHNSKGRGTGGPNFIQLHHWFLQSPAWRSLGVYARALYVEMRARYNGSNNGGIVMSHRDAQELLACSNKPIPGAFRELQEKGFIALSQRGSFAWKHSIEGKLRASTWTLTELSVDLPIRSGMPATKDFMRWQPEEKKSRPALSVPYARLKRTIDDEMARRERTVRTPRAYHSDENEPVDGTLRAGTFSLPDTPDAESAFTSMETLTATILNTARPRPAHPQGRGARRAG